ncbi:Tor complex Tor2 interacting protein 1 [Dionaea muscipula]
MASDPSDPYTNSTTLFSDDTDEKSRKSSIPEMTVQAHQEDELNNPAPDPMHADSYEYQPDMAEISNWPTGQCFSCPKKSELKTGRGESSAFFSYVKPSLFKANSHAGASDGKNTTTSSPIVDDISKEAWRNHLRNNTTLRYEHGEACENNSQGDEFTSSTCSFPNSTPPPPPPASLGLLQNKSSAEGLTSPVHVQHPPRNGTQFDIAGFSAHAAYPYYTRGGMNEPPMMITTYQQDLQSHAATSAVAPHFNHLGLPSFPYYPVGMGMGMGMRLQPSQMPSFGSSNSRETKPNTVDRREAALVKFRQKRKDRCFDKKIMYANRKRLAERMPRVRGQFVRKVNGVMVDLYGLAEYDDEEEEEDDIDPSSSS